MTAASSSALLSFSGIAKMDLPRLYCFPYAGGTSSIFAPWGRLLASTVSVMGVDLPGHGSRFRDSMLPTIQDMARSAASLIMAAQSSPSQSAPFFFYGHSLGAVVAYETARLLEENCSVPLGHLFVGAARAPEEPAPVPAISHLDDQAFLNAVQARYGGLPAILFEEPELLAMVLPVLRADFRSYETYESESGARVLSPITAFFGEQDAVVTARSMEMWSRVSTGQFHLQAMKGGHFFLNECRDQLLSCIGRTIQESSMASRTALSRSLHVS